MANTYHQGFEYKNFKFAFKNKILFRLPTIKNGRNYPLREVPVISLSKTGRGYRLIRTKKSLAQVRSMIQKVNWKVNNKYFNCI